MRKAFTLPKLLVVTAFACGSPTHVADAGNDGGTDAGLLCDGGTNTTGVPDCSCGCGGACPGACNYVQPNPPAAGLCECLV